MRKSFLIVFLFVLIVSVGCTSSRSSDNTNEPKTYRINKSTGLYASTSPDAEQIEVLSVGDKVNSTNRSGDLTCVTNGENMKLCRVESVKSGEQGWVLIQWLDD